MKQSYDFWVPPATQTFQVIVGSLNDPLGLTVNGHILVVNGNHGFITEITPRGEQLAKVLLDNTGGPPPGNGTLFGVTFDPRRGVLFVDDGSNTLNSLN